MQFKILAISVILLVISPKFAFAETVGSTIAATPTPTIKPSQTPLPTPTATPLILKVDPIKFGADNSGNYALGGVVIGGLLTLAGSFLLELFKRKSRQEENRKKSAKTVLAGVIKYQTFVSNTLEQHILFGRQGKTALDETTNMLTQKRVEYLAEPKAIVQLEMTEKIKDELTSLFQSQDLLVEVMLDEMHGQKTEGKSKDERWKIFNKCYKSLVSTLKIWVKNGK